ncbi:MAG TPA: hypothetical protein VFU21_01740 [Kofleriaceae bacterium]|nr:hypothetical protein [Kofleriaceae bacterium]
MAKAFDTWTVLPHKPIEKLADNLWRVTGTMPNGRTRRQMVLARLADGRVLVHNAIALSEAEMAEIEAWGAPAVLFVPNGFHRQDAAIWKQRYPSMTVVAPAGSRKRVEQVVPVDATSDQVQLDDAVSLAPIEGVPAESVLQIRSADGVTLVVCDALFNLPRGGAVENLLFGPTGKVAVARVARWFLVKDRRAYARALQRWAETPDLCRVLVGHGRPIVDDPATQLRSAAAQIS